MAPARCRLHDSLRTRGPTRSERLCHARPAAGSAGARGGLSVPPHSGPLTALGDVAADMLKRCGMNVDYVATDWGTMLQRRTKRTTVDQGGWSVFVTGWTGLDWMNPATDIPLRGNGLAGYPGWYESETMEALRNAWIVAPDQDARVRVAQDMQRLAMQDVPFWPLGQYFQATASRTSVTGIPRGFATFWNVRPA